MPSYKWWIYADSEKKVPAIVLPVKLDTHILQEFK